MCRAGEGAVGAVQARTLPELRVAFRTFGCKTNQYDTERMRQEIGVDSLAFIGLDGLYRALGEAGGRGAAPAFCDACFTGDYPIDLLDRRDGAAADRMSLLDELA